MFIDTTKVAQINRRLSTLTLSGDSVSREKLFDNIFKSLIRLLIPYKRAEAFDDLTDALKGEKEMSVEVMQNLVERLKNIFSDEVDELDVAKYHQWIKENESKWKEKTDPINLDKLFYGLARET